MYKYIIVVFIILFVACSDKEYSAKKIEFDISNNLVEGDLLVDSVVYLETIDESLLSEVSILKYMKGNIYILDKDKSKSLFVFDENGKFLKKTAKGKGPGECLTPFDFLISSENNEILIWDQMSKRMNHYDLELNFIKSNLHQDLTIRNFKRTKDHYLVYSKDNLNDIAYSYLLYNTDFTEIETKIPMDYPELISLSLPSVISEGEYTRYLKVFDNRIYGLKNGEEFIDCFLDFGNLNVTENDIDEGIDHVFSLAYAGKRVVSIHDLIYNQNYIAFSFFYNGGMHSCVYSLNSKSSYYFGPYIHKALANCQIKAYMPETKTFIATADATKVDKFEDKSLSSVRINRKYSNPAVIFFKIKE